MSAPDSAESITYFFFKKFKIQDHAQCSLWDSPVLGSTEVPLDIDKVSMEVPGLVH